MKSYEELKIIKKYMKVIKKYHFLGILMNILQIKSLSIIVMPVLYQL